MIWATDALLISKVVDLLPQYVDRIIYGTPAYARKYWAYFNNDKPGVMSLPWWSDIVTGKQIGRAHV